MPRLPWRDIGQSTRVDRCESSQVRELRKQLTRTWAWVFVCHGTTAGHWQRENESFSVRPQEAMG